MYVFNKTSEYISSLTPSQIKHIISEVTRKAQKELRQNLKDREQKLHSELVQKQLKTSRQEQLKQKEDLTSGMYNNRCRLMAKSRNGE